jgi:predicted AAA+ superfamily ATPase
VDFVAENHIGEVVPIEVKFRRSIHGADFTGLKAFSDRFRPKHGIMVTRDIYQYHEDIHVLCVPLMEFLLAF